MSSPEDQLPSSHNQIDALLLQGANQFEKSEWTEALETYERIIAMDPGNEIALDKLGVIFARKKNFDKASLYFQKILSINPRSKEALNNQGNLYLELNNLQEAVKYYRRALEIDSNYAYAYNNLAVAFKKKGDIQNYVKNSKIYAQLEKHERRRKLRKSLQNLFKK
jgi:superkiller protein 3